MGRLNYSYDDKYYLGASLRYDGSYLFGGMDKRWITLPGVSVGWRINNEDWFDVSSVNNLKFRIGAGKRQQQSQTFSVEKLNEFIKKCDYIGRK